MIEHEVYIKCLSCVFKYPLPIGLTKEDELVILTHANENNHLAFKMYKIMLKPEVIGRIKIVKGSVVYG